MNDDIRLQVAWDRLVALVEDQARTLMRSAFSPIVRESGDLSAGIFDTEARMLAQARTGTPGHVNTMARSVRQMLEIHGAESIVPGDVLVTNDPWIGTGHLNDFVVATPAFREGRIVAWFACTGHITDVGGIGLSPDSRDLFSEGVRVPVTRLVAAGAVNRPLIELLRANSRLPDELEGDLFSLIASNATGVSRLGTFLTEIGEPDLARIGAHILTRSEAAMRAAIRAVPNGSARHTLRADGYDAPVDLAATLRIEDETVHIDWTGTSAASPYGINVPLGYTAAYASYALSCALAPDVPNNHGSLSMFETTAPEGAILNARFPQPVSCRHILGALVPDVIFGCLDQIVPGRVPAESASALWTLSFRSAPETAAGYSIMVTTNGGTGARPGLDGLSATSFPSAVRGTPVEMIEAQVPLVFWKRELRSGSGGAGRQRGGLGQSLEVAARKAEEDFLLIASFDRIENPARGRAGGGPGAPGTLSLDDGTALPGKGELRIRAGRRLRISTPGGGGYGPADERAADARGADSRFGYTTQEPAQD